MKMVSGEWLRPPGAVYAAVSVAAGVDHIDTA